MLLRRCLRRQLPKQWEPLDLTPFGRALLQTGNPNNPEAVLYWVRLPSWEWRERLYDRRYGWHQAVLFWHGHEGFQLRWISSE